MATQKVTIIIYSNDGQEELWSAEVDVKMNGVYVEPFFGYSPLDGFPKFQVFFNNPKGDNVGGGVLAIYEYEGDGFFEGVSYEPNSDIPEPEGTVWSWDDDFTTRLYVVDMGKIVQVRYEHEVVENPLILSLTQGQTGVLPCKDNIMEEDIRIKSPLRISLPVQVYLGEEKILEISSGQTGVLACKDTIMPDNIRIVVPAEEGD
jgi:hypothetical protein